MAKMLLMYLISRHDYSNNHDVLSRFKCSVLGQGGRACAKSRVYQTTPTPVLALRTASYCTENEWTPKNTDVLVLDDWGLVGMDAQTRTDLLEMIDDRAGRKATIITSQLPIEHWHEWIGDATVADAMLDRIMQNNHRLTLTGESLRKTKTSQQREENRG